MNIKNTQFDSQEDFESTITRLFYRCLLQLWIHLYYPEEFIIWIVFHFRDDAIANPVGKLPFEFRKTTFDNYIRSYYKEKHPDDVVPSPRLLLLFYMRNRRNWYLLQNLSVFISVVCVSLCVNASISFVFSFVCILHCRLGYLLESLIIADRMLYLQRNKTNTKVCCVFDRKQSPRCMCIIAQK